MANGWEGFVPAPLEFFHGELMNQFHRFRKANTDDDFTVPINGVQLNNLIAKAKKATYAKYPNSLPQKPIKQEEA